MAYKLDGKDPAGHRLWVQKTKAGYRTFCYFGCKPVEVERKQDD